jgi:hypothetical protein
MLGEATLNGSVTFLREAIRFLIPFVAPQSGVPRRQGLTGGRGYTMLSSIISGHAFKACGKIQQIGLDV